MLQKIISLLGFVLYSVLLDSLLPAKVGQRIKKLLN
jgi:hypothetical protein